MASARGLAEARYLTAIFNSDTLLELGCPPQARGEHNPRDFDKYVLRLPVPLYDADAELHLYPGWSRAAGGASRGRDPLVPGKSSRRCGGPSGPRWPTPALASAAS